MSGGSKGILPRFRPDLRLTRPARGKQADAAQALTADSAGVRLTKQGALAGPDCPGHRHEAEQFVWDCLDASRVLGSKGLAFQVALPGLGGPWSMAESHEIPADQNEPWPSKTVKS